MSRLPVYFYLFLIFLLNTNNGFSQTSEINKMHSSLRLINDSNKYADRLNQISTFLRFRNGDSSLYYAKKALEISSNNSYLKGEADALNNMGCVYSSFSPELARRYSENAVRIYQTIDDQEGICEAMVNLADFLPNTKNTSRKYLQHLYESSKSLTRDSIRASIIASMIYNNFHSSRKFDRSLFQEGLSIAKKYKSKFLTTAYSLINAIEFYKANKKSGLDTLRKFISQLEHSGPEFIKIFSYYYIGPLMLNEGNDHLGIFYLTKIIQKTEKTHPFIYINALKSLYFYYESHHQDHKAYECIVLIFKKEIELEEFVAESSYDYNQFMKRQQAHQLRTSKESFKKKTIILLSCLFTLSLVLLLFLYRSLQIKKKYVKVQNQLNEMIKIQNKDLQDNNTFNNMLISIIAHDIRQPFNSVVMLSSIFNKNVNLLSPQKKLEIMDELGQISQQSLGFMDGILEWIKSKRNGFEYRQEKLDLNEIILEANTFFTSAQKRKSIKFISTIPKQTVVHAHKQMLSFIVRNMINNATKFSPKFGCIAISSIVKNNETIITIEDQGPGMSKQQLDILFSLNYMDQEDNSNDGARIAMRVSQELASIMRAKIYAISEPNIRTIFYLSLKNESVSKQ